MDEEVKLVGELINISETTDDEEEALEYSNSPITDSLSSIAESDSEDSAISRSSSDSDDV